MNLLEKLKSLQAAATPGPWDREGFYNVLRIAKKSLDWELVHPTEDTLMPDEDDAEYIVTLRNALPDLLELADIGDELATAVREWSLELNNTTINDCVVLAIRYQQALAKLEVEA